MIIKDIIVSIGYFVIIIIVANLIKKHFIKEKLKKHFIYGLYLKLLGAIFTYIIYFFYYGTGDTVYYFKRSEYIKFILSNNFNLGLKLLFKNPQVYDPETYGIFIGLRAFDASSYIVVKIVTIFNLFCFGSYPAIALCFASLSFFGIWKLFNVIYETYPEHIKVLSISFLYLPSLIFWGSGIFKDTITMGFLSLLVSYFIQFIFFKKITIRGIFFCFISVYIIGVIKSYIIIAIIPALMFLLFLSLRNKISNSIIKNLSTPIFIIAIISISLISLNILSSVFTKFNINNLEDRASDMQRWHTYKVEVLQGGDGSAYSLGQIDYTPIGIIKKIPLAINVALFRPYLWEVSNPLMLLSSFESLFFLIQTLFFLYYAVRSLGKLFNILNNNSIIVFMMLFSLIFAFAVGFTSYNFGALSRYRIPLLPFYISSIMILTEKLKSLKQK
ncbi:MAG: hypothetical protein R2836_08665 [Chitinophagales bacterium]|nr:hypothetical protein [Chitinophagales bacterium]